MRRAFCSAVVLAGLLAAPEVYAQAPAGDSAGSAQDKNSQPSAPPAAGSNPFPDDTSTVPVISTDNPPAEPSGGAAAAPAMPSGDADPARSPDDPQPAASDDGDGFSSSLKGIENVAPPEDSETPAKNKKKQPTHQEAAAEDIQVGKYYLTSKSWKAALSRFQSAMVLDPENPEVYWGLAEAERHLNDFAQARAYYQKLLDYDPDGPHGKEARKAMKDPQIANAQSSAASRSGAPSPQ